jgi:hypothetical protein
MANDGRMIVIYAAGRFAACCEMPEMMRLRRRRRRAFFFMGALNHVIGL